LSSHWSIAILAFSFCSIALCNASLHLGLGYNHKPGVRVCLHQSGKVSRVLNDDPIAALGVAMDNNSFTSDVLSDYFIFFVTDTSPSEGYTPEVNRGTMVIYRKGKELV
jgi:hypothetical protein